VSAPAFVRACNRGLAALHGTQLSGKAISSLACSLTELVADGKAAGPRRLRIVDKHGLSRNAYNLQIGIELEGQQLSLGLEGSQLPQNAEELTVARRRPAAAPSAEKLIEDLASVLKKRSTKTTTED
jgi:hypothetical protein